MTENEMNVAEAEEDLVIDDTPIEEEGTTNEDKPLLDEEDPLNPKTIKAVEGMMRQMEGILRTMQGQWIATIKELHLNDTHMKMLAKWNTDHRTKMPDDISEEERDKWDHLNGIDCITDDAIHEIFGDEHPICGVQHDQTVDRIKSACQDFYAYLSAMREYRDIHDSYLKLLDLQEEKAIESLREDLEKIPEEELEKREKLQKAIDQYYYTKYLEFLPDISDEMFERIIKGLTNPKKIQYWLNRAHDKLSQMKISANIIPELSQFEKRFMTEVDERYAENSGVLVLYFIITCAYCNTSSPEDIGRTQVACMVHMLDAYIRKTLEPEKRERVLNNLIIFEEKFLGKCPQPEKKEHEITPPITEESNTTADE